MLLGEVGLLLAVVEAGLHVQLPALRQVGTRCVAAAILGSLAFPVPVAYALSRALSLGATEAVAVAVCLVPSSTGVALLILRRAKLLNTPTGQLVVAASALDDVIALICISELRALKKPSAAAFATPIGAAAGYVLGVGAAAVYLVPPALNAMLVPNAAGKTRVPARLLEKTTLAVLAALTAGLCTALERGGSSYLLGAFLAGVCFCTLPTITHVWERQVKRIATWLLRIFFGATIGFEVPITRFASPPVLKLAAALLLALAGKGVTGALARPRHGAHVLTVAFSMTTLGELAFVAAAVGHHELHLTTAVRDLALDSAPESTLNSLTFMLFLLTFRIRLRPCASSSSCPTWLGRACCASRCAATPPRRSATSPPQSQPRQRTRTRRRRRSRRRCCLRRSSIRTRTPRTRTPHTRTRMAWPQPPRWSPSPPPPHSPSPRFPLPRPCTFSTGLTCAAARAGASWRTCCACWPCTPSA
jgi:Kef-type K+ transport system membrane component KefB